MKEQSIFSRSHTSAHRLACACVVSVLALFLPVGSHGQTFSVVANFGIYPGGPWDPELDVLVKGRDGNLYSATTGGGANGLGAAFRVSLTGNGALLHSFNGSDGSYPLALTLGTDGYFYGITGGGGTFGAGTIYKMDTAGNVTVIYNFTGGSDGRSPSPLIEGRDGNFYGTARYNGAPSCNYPGCGTIFKITPSGTFTLLHQFDGADGFEPIAPLLLGSDGKFYGTTAQGGGTGYGVIFQVTSSGRFSVIHDFSYGKGVAPYAPLIEGSDGSLYGTTPFGGQGPNQGDGVIYKLSRSGGYTVLHYFNYVTDGIQPFSGLVQATDGNFYGANPWVGAHGFGTLYRLTPSGDFSVLYNFDYTTGSAPQTTPLQNTDGVIYGETLEGGTGTQCTYGNTEGCGVVYKLDVGLPPFVTFLPPQRAGRVGQKIQIFGQGFTGTTAVSFNGTAANFTVVRDTFMTATVPSGATTGVVMVMTPSGLLNSNEPFTVLP